MALSVQPLDGFASSVRVTIGGLPPAVDALPGTLIDIAPGQVRYLTIRAADQAPTTATLTLDARGGGAMDQATLPLSVVAPTTHPVPSGWVRTFGMVQSIAYDPATHLAFATVPSANEVAVIDVPDARVVARLPIPYPTTAALAPDGTTVWVGSSMVEYASAIDVRTLSVRRFPFPGATPTAPEREPRQIVPLFDGTLLVQPGWGAGSPGPLTRWDPVTGSAWKLTTLPWLLSTYAVVAWPPDGRRALVSDLSTIVVYDAVTDSFGPSADGNGARAVFRADGGQLAVPVWGGVSLLDANLAPVGTWRGSSDELLAYRPDGQQLFLKAMLDSPWALDVATQTSAGLLPEFLWCAEPLLFYGAWWNAAMDERGILLVPCEGGVRLVDTAGVAAPPPQWVGLNGPFPWVTDPAGSTPVTIYNSTYGATTPPVSQVLFGDQRGTDVNVDAVGIRVTAPPSALPGSTTVLVQFADGWRLVKPDAFWYGPTLLALFPNGGPPSGGTSFVPRMEGIPYGATTTLRLGGQAIPLSGTPAKAVAPPGAPGLAEVAVDTAEGHSILRGGWQYIAALDDYPAPGSIFQIVYDRARQQVYASAPDLGSVLVFSLRERRWLAPIPVGPVPLGIALAPDGSKLAVAQFGDGTVTLLDPDNPAQRASVPVLDPLDTAASPEPYHVAIANDGRVLVALVRQGISGCFSVWGHHQVREIAPDLSVRSIVIDPVCEPEFLRLTASPDGSRIAVSYTHQMAGDVFLWDAAIGGVTAHTRGAFLWDVSLGRATASVGHAVHDAALWRRSYPTQQSRNDMGGEGFAERIHAEGTFVYVRTAAGLSLLDGRTGELVRVFGLPIAVRGSGFGGGDQVLVDGVAAATTFVNPNTLLAALPAGPVGPVSVAVRTTDGQKCRPEVLVNRTP